MNRINVLAVAVSVAGALVMSSCSGEGEYLPDKGWASRSPTATTQSLPIASPAATAPAPDLIAEIPSNARGCKALARREIKRFLVKNIDVTMDQAQGSPDGPSEGYYCGLRGLANINEETRHGLISRDLNVRFFRIGSPQAPDEAGIRSRWTLLLDMSGAEKKIDVPRVDEAVYDTHPDANIPSVDLLVRHKNVIVWVGWNDNDPKVDQQHVTKEAVDIAVLVLHRIAA